MIMHQLDALDSTFPEELKNELDDFVPLILHTQVENMDEEKEDALIRERFDNIISKIQQVVESE